MIKKLYDCVPVHGQQGKYGKTKAYACYNCMEFFAELSVAFFWQQDFSQKNNVRSVADKNGNGDDIGNNITDFISDHNINNDNNNVNNNNNANENIFYSCDLEFNKWFPHNFKQLKIHDIDSCNMLALMWNVDIKNIPDIVKNVHQNVPQNFTKSVLQNIVKNVPLNSLSSPIYTEESSLGNLSEKTGDVVTSDDMFYTIN